MTVLLSVLLLALGAQAQNKCLEAYPASDEAVTLQRSDAPAQRNKIARPNRAFFDSYFTNSREDFYKQNQIDRELRNRKVVEVFYANSSLSNDDEVKRAQSELLSPHLTAYLSDHRGEKFYEGANSYFDLLTDWTNAFARGPDFRVEITQQTSRRVVVRVHGTLNLLRPIHGHALVPDTRHSWTELFTIAEDGSIERIEVLMNLFRK